MVKNEQIIYLFLMGFIVIPCAFIVLTVAPRYAPAHEVTLIFLLESILGTLWVWFVIKEQPSAETIVGGVENSRIPCSRDPGPIIVSSRVL